MDRTLIFYHPRNREAAEAMAAGIPGAQVRSLKGWNGHVEEPAERVVVDDDAPDVAEAYRAGAAAVEWLSGGAVPDPEPEPEPEADEAPSLPTGYELVQSGSWFKVMGPDGQVGNAKRDPDEAIRQVTG